MKRLEIKKIKSHSSSLQKRSNKNYGNFLKGEPKKVESGNNNKDKKVILVKRKKNSPRISRSNDIRDINDIEHKMIQMKNNKIQVPTQNISTPVIKKTKTEKTKTEKTKLNNLTKPNKQVTKVRISDIDVSENRSENKPVPKPVPKPVRKTHKSNKRLNHRSKSKPNRKVSVKTFSFNEDKVKKVETRMKEIRGKNTDEIKRELEKQGLKVTGKSNRLLRDIYLYSKVCNINIHHEK